MTRNKILTENNFKKNDYSGQVGIGINIIQIKISYFFEKSNRFQEISSKACTLYTI